MIWKKWTILTLELKDACSRTQTFLWMCVCLAGMTIRTDLLGTTSIVRAMGLLPFCYDRILDFMHSPSLNLNKLTNLWCRLVFKQSGIIRYAGRPVLVGDGIKVSKSGKKMPAVKKLHQQSESNTKPEYIFGHSCQTVSVLMKAAKTIFAVPLTCRIHEGLVFSNRDKRTLLDKMINLIGSLCIEEPFYFVADAYYASGKIVSGLFKNDNHLITRVRSNAVAYMPIPEPHIIASKKRGRPAIYGKKVNISSLLKDEDNFTFANSTVYGEKGVSLRYRTLDLLWKPVGILVRFVVVKHPTRGSAFLMCTDLNLSPLEIIEIYGLRFKIELSFKQAVHVIGTFTYRFWMGTMTPFKRKKGNQYLHRKSSAYRDKIRRKLTAYHRYIQLGLIAQGLLQILAATYPDMIRRSFGSWFRTIRTGLAPSELMVAISLRNTLPDFLSDNKNSHIWTKFVRDRLDFNRIEGIRMISWWKKT
jgi:hypothetical protein